MLVIAAVIWLTLVVFLVKVPGRVARERRHTAREAIEVCAYLGVLFPIAWLVALIWAHTQNNTSPAASTSYRPKPTREDVEWELEKRERAERQQPLDFGEIPYEEELAEKDRRRPRR
jgi:hypothetical protein